ncbi:MAG: hypothetical protein SGPRY_013737 [Prymnesium sp.]
MHAAEAELASLANGSTPSASASSTKPALPPLSSEDEMARLMASMEGRSSGDVDKGGLEGGGGGKRPSEDHELAALVTSMHSAVPPPVAEPEPELQVKRRGLNVILSLRVSLRGVGRCGERFVRQ